MKKKVKGLAYEMFRDRQGVIRTENTHGITFKEEPVNKDPSYNPHILFKKKYYSHSRGGYLDLSPSSFSLYSGRKYLSDVTSNFGNFTDILTSSNTNVMYGFTIYTVRSRTITIRPKIANATVSVWLDTEQLYTSGKYPYIESDISFQVDGAKVLRIFVYKETANASFSLTGDLGNQIDGWSSLDVSPPDAPEWADTNPISTNIDPNLNSPYITLQWKDPVISGMNTLDIAGYTIYRESQLIPLSYNGTTAISGYFAYIPGDVSPKLIAGNQVTLNSGNNYFISYSQYSAETEETQIRVESEISEDPGAIAYVKEYKPHATVPYFPQTNGIFTFRDNDVNYNTSYTYLLDAYDVMMNRSPKSTTQNISIASAIPAKVSSVNSVVVGYKKIKSTWSYNHNQSYPIKEFKIWNETDGDSDSVSSAGANTVTISDGSIFSPGDLLIIDRTSTWLSDIVTQVDGNTITVANNFLLAPQAGDPVYSPLMLGTVPPTSISGNQFPTGQQYSFLYDADVGNEYRFWVSAHNFQNLANYNNLAFGGPVTVSGIQPPSYNNTDHLFSVFTDIESYPDGKQALATQIGQYGYTYSPILAVDVEVSDPYTDHLLIQCAEDDSGLATTQKIGVLRVSGSNKILEPTYFNQTIKGETYYFRMASADVYGNRSSWGAYVTETAGDTTGPNEITTSNLRVTTRTLGFDAEIVSYTEANDLDRYEWFLTTTNSFPGGNPIETTVKPKLNMSTTAGVKYLFIRAVDTSGNYSANYTTAVATFTVPDVDTGSTGYGATLDADTILLARFRNNANDETTYDNDFLISGSVSYTTGKTETGTTTIALDNYDYLYISGSGSGFDTADDGLTVDAWIKTSAAISGTDNWHSVFNHSYSLYLRGGTDYKGLVFEVCLYNEMLPRQVTAFSDLDGLLNDGTWHHIAGTYEKDGTSQSLNLYLDGVLNNTYDFTSSNTLDYGSDDDCPAIGGNLHYFEGYVDELRVSNVARTDWSHITGGVVIGSPEVPVQVGSVTASLIGYQTMRVEWTYDHNASYPIKTFKVWNEIDGNSTVIISVSDSREFDVNHPSYFTEGNPVVVLHSGSYYTDMIQSVVGSTVTLVNGLAVTPSISDTIYAPVSVANVIPLAAASNKYPQGQQHFALHTGEVGNDYRFWVSANNRENVANMLSLAESNVITISGVQAPSYNNTDHLFSQKSDIILKPGGEQLLSSNIGHYGTNTFSPIIAMNVEESNSKASHLLIQCATDEQGTNLIEKAGTLRISGSTNVLNPTYFTNTVKGTQYHFRMASVDAYNNKSSWGSWVTETAGDTTGPDQITSNYVFIDTLDYGFEATISGYTQADDHDRYEWFVNSVDSFPPGDPLSTTIKGKVNLSSSVGSKYLFVRSVDTSGNYSSSYTSSVAQISNFAGIPPLVQNLRTDLYEYKKLRTSWSYDHSPSIPVLQFTVWNNTKGEFTFISSVTDAGEFDVNEVGIFSEGAPIIVVHSGSFYTESVASISGDTLTLVNDLAVTPSASDIIYVPTAIATIAPNIISGQTYPTGQQYSYIYDGTLRQTYRFWVSAHNRQNIANFHSLPLGGPITISGVQPPSYNSTDHLFSGFSDIESYSDGRQTLASQVQFYSNQYSPILAVDVETDDPYIGILSIQCAEDESGTNTIEKLGVLKVVSGVNKILEPTYFNHTIKGTQYYFRMSSVDIYGNMSDWGSWVTETAGDSVGPNEITTSNISYSSDDYGFKVYITNYTKTDDFDRYEVFLSSTSAFPGGTPDKTTPNNTIYFNKGYGTYYLFIRAVDTSGNYSANYQTNYKVMYSRRPFIPFSFKAYTDEYTVLLLDFENNANDSSSYSNNFTISGSSTFGMGNSSLGFTSFRSTADNFVYKEGTLEGLESVTDEVTVEALIRTDSAISGTDNWYTVFDNTYALTLRGGDPYNGLTFEVLLVDEVLPRFVYAPFDMDGILNDGNWHHIAGSYERDGSSHTLNLYHNGLLLVTSGFTADHILDNGTGQYIAATTGNMHYLEGWIDEIRVSNIARSDFSYINDGTDTYTGLPIQNLDIAAQGWQTSFSFSSSNYNTVAWSSGSFIAADGTTYSISSGNTGGISALTYIYLDTNTSTTTLQTTTTSTDAVGVGKVLIGWALHNSDTNKKATYQIFGGAGGQGISVTADNIVAQSITGNEISANTITGANILAATISGTLVAANTITAGEIASNTITASEIAASTITATEMNISQLSAIAANMGTITAGNVTLDTSGFLKGGQTDYDTGTGFWMGYTGGKYKFSIGDASYSMKWDGTGLNVNGAVVTNPAVNTSPSLLGWQFASAFSSSDYNTVAWGSGSLKLSTGTTYSISAGNTGSMSARTYIYLDVDVSTTVLQTTTTAANAVGHNKILVAVAEDNADSGSDATFQVFGGTGGLLITADSIAANTLTANEIASNTITATEMNVSQLSAIAADLGSISAGSVTGVTITGGTLQTASANQRIVLAGSDNTLKFYDSSNNLIITIDDNIYASTPGIKFEQDSVVRIEATVSRQSTLYGGYLAISDTGTHTRNFLSSFTKYDDTTENIRNLDISTQNRNTGDCYGVYSNLITYNDSDGTSYAIYGKINALGSSGPAWAGYFEGDVKVNGIISGSNASLTTITTPSGDLTIDPVGDIQIEKNTFSDGGVYAQVISGAYVDAPNIIDRIYELERYENLGREGLPFDVPAFIWNKEADMINSNSLFSVHTAQDPGDGKVEIICSGLMGLDENIIGQSGQWYYAERSGQEWVSNSREVLIYNSVSGYLKLDSTDWEGNSNSNVPSQGTNFRLNGNMTPWVHHSFDVAKAALIDRSPDDYVMHPWVFKDDVDNSTGDKTFMLYIKKPFATSWIYTYATADHPIGPFTKSGTTLIQDSDLPSGYELHGGGGFMVRNTHQWRLYVTGQDTGDSTDDYLFMFTAPNLRGPWSFYQTVSGVGQVYNNKNGTYDYNGLTMPRIIYWNGEWVMAYTSKDSGNKRHLNIATSSDGLAFVPSSSNPVLSSPLNTGWGGSTDNSVVIIDGFVVHQGILHGFITGYDEWGAGGRSTGLFTPNADYTEWKEYPLNPILKARPWQTDASTAFGKGHIGGLCIYKHRGVWYAYFQSERTGNDYDIFVMYRNCYDY
jgi:hypothetical protein